MTSALIAVRLLRRRLAPVQPTPAPPTRRSRRFARRSRPLPAASAAFRRALIASPDASALVRSLAEALRQNPQEVYGGLLSTLMRLVFVLYAEDRNLISDAQVYQENYSLTGLFERLRDVRPGEGVVVKKSSERVSTTVVRPGSGRPIESQVARPMTSVWPRVTSLKCAKSSEIFHGMSASAPITPFSATAATIVTRRPAGVLIPRSAP